MSPCVLEITPQSDPFCFEAICISCDDYLQSLGVGEAEQFALQLSWPIKTCHNMQSTLCIIMSRPSEGAVRGHVG